MAAGLLIFSLSFVSAWVLLRFLLQSRWSSKAVDVAGERSLHQGVVPRLGGWAFVPGLLGAFVWVLLAEPEARSVWWPIVVGWGVLVALSWADDLQSKSARLRFLVQLLVCLGWAISVVWVFSLPLIFAGLLAAGALWALNLYNFMDGADGFSGSMAVCGFGAFAAAAGVDGAWAMLCVNAAVVGAALGFLRFNWHPAKSFMGDSGSVPLGFLAATLGVVGVVQGYWSVAFALLSFAPFGFDATVTLLRRFARREKVWRAHREHFYQRLIRTGVRHDQMSARALVVMLVCVALAWTVRRADSLAQGAVVGLAVLFLTGLALIIDRRFQRAGLKP